MKDGGTIRVSIPDHWKESEKRNKDRVILSADLPLDEITVGNLPVIEMKNRALTDDELERMVQYFAGEEMLYQPHIDTKQGYQEVMKRIREKALWFPKDTSYPQGVADVFLDDQIWQADPKQAEPGYRYVFTRGQGGLFTDQMKGSTIADEVGGSYAPPFPVEKVSVAVTASGVKAFEWDGICEEVGTAAENTRLLPFEEIQKNIFDYMYYLYLELGQPENSKSVFEYSVSDIRLGYTYVPAYGNPEHAWLVPAWFVRAEVHADMTEELGKAYDWEHRELMVNALDGGLIAWQM